MDSTTIKRALKVIPEEDFIFVSDLKQANLNGNQVKSIVPFLEELGLIDVKRKGRYTLIRKKPEVSS